MRFSIIVPTFNEEKDIIETLEALVSLDYPDKEILIVDDSTDSTPEVVQRYSDLGVRLIRPGGGGRCEARNKGILMATGEVLCILNADVRPEKDYLQRLVVHYQQGADYVLVASRVSNRNKLFARYVDCKARVRYRDPKLTEWTEGFSCRKEIAVQAGLFPSGYLIPICAGEDGEFGERLKKIEARKLADLSIVVDHVAPSSFQEYWRVRKGRGIGSVQIHRFLKNWSFWKIFAWNLLKTIRSIFYLVSVVPALLICWKAARFSEYGVRDLFPFLYAWMIEQAAFHTGEWQSSFQILRVERKSVHASSG